MCQFSLSLSSRLWDLTKREYLGVGTDGRQVASPADVVSCGLRLALYNAAREHLCLTALISDGPLRLPDTDGRRLKSGPLLLLWAKYVTGDW